MAKEMTLLEHFEELRTRLVRSLIAVVIITAFTITFSIQEVNLNGQTVPLPVPDPMTNIGNQLINRFHIDIVYDDNGDGKPDIPLIQTEPGQAFFAAIWVSVFLGLVFSMPIIVHEMSAFIGPGLYPHERRMIGRLVIPASLLFAAGAVFCYAYVLPFTFRFLYAFAPPPPSNPVQFVSIMTMVTFTLQFMLGFGLAFQLPIFMWVLTRVGLVQPRFWRNNLRYAVVGIVIFGAVITPDGSGITLWFVALPMLALYVGGYWATKRIVRPVPLVAKG